MVIQSVVRLSALRFHHPAEALAQKTLQACILFACVPVEWAWRDDMLRVHVSSAALQDLR